MWGTCNIVKFSHWMWQDVEMFRVKVHNYSEKIISFFFRIGRWHQGDEETVPAAVLTVSYICGFCSTLITPFIGVEKKLFFSIGFPLDWKNNEFDYCIGAAFIFTQMFLSRIALLVSVMIWYLLMNCGLQYVALGHQIKNMGAIKSVDKKANKRKISNIERDNLYRRDNNLKELLY